MKEFLIEEGRAFLFIVTSKKNDEIKRGRLNEVKSKTERCSFGEGFSQDKLLSSDRKNTRDPLSLSLTLEFVNTKREQDFRLDFLLTERRETRSV